MLEEYLEKTKPKYYPPVENLLDLVYEHYTENNSIALENTVAGKVAKEKEKELETWLRGLPRMDEMVEDYGIDIPLWEKIIDKYTGNLFYWYPAKCKEDQRQYNSIKSCENIHFFAMDQSEHGATLWGESIIRTLELKPEKIIDLSEKYAGSLIKPVTYCRESSGFIKATVILFGKAMRKYR